MKTPTKATADISYYEVRGKQRVFTKYAIALRAVTLLDEGDALLIDAGTSLTPIAKLIRRMADTLTEQTHYTVMTHNNEAFNALSDTPPHARFNVFQTGGRYDLDLNASFGHQAKMAYLRFHPRWVFIGHNGCETDLGVFCHGNTEELALKKEIFSMPAWGRVVISDFTKMGKPGGLLFGDSANLITNVDHCIVISDDVHDEKFKDYIHDEEGRRAVERFEAQVRELQETYQVTVELVHFVVIQDELDGDRDKTHAPSSLKNAQFLGKPEDTLAELMSTPSRLSNCVFRIYCTDLDVNSLADLEPANKNAWGYVDISFQSRSEKLLGVTVENLHFFRRP